MMSVISPAAPAPAPAPAPLLPRMPDPDTDPLSIWSPLSTSSSTSSSNSNSSSSSNVNSETRKRKLPNDDTNIDDNNHYSAYPTSTQALESTLTTKTKASTSPSASSTSISHMWKQAKFSTNTHKETHHTYIKNHIQPYPNTQSQSHPPIYSYPSSHPNSYPHPHPHLQHGRSSTASSSLSQSTLSSYLLPRPPTYRPLPPMTWSSCQYLYVPPTQSTCCADDCPFTWDSVDVDADADADGDGDADSADGTRTSPRPIRQRRIRSATEIISDPFATLRNVIPHKPKPRYKMSDLAIKLTHQVPSESPAFQLTVTQQLKAQAHAETEATTHIKLREDPIKGVGVYTSCAITAGDFVCEYGGELITRREAEEREEAYAQQDPPPGCYMFYFVHANKHWCIDSTTALPSYGVGRYINHSRTRNNLSTIRVVDHHGRPHLCFVASVDMEPNTELLFDYGDRANADHFTWLNE